MSLAIITVVYQNYTVLQDFLDGLRNQLSSGFHIFIVDGSVDKQTIDTGQLPATVVIAENKGYAHAVNVGVERAVAEGHTTFAIVNSDIIFSNKFVESVSASISAHPNSIIGGKIYYAPGYEYHKDKYRNEEKGKVFWYTGGAIDWSHVQASHRGVDEVDRGQYEKFEETGFVTGCLVCYDISVYKSVGTWDSGYFMYYEDTDFSVRAQRLGVKTHYDPSIIIWHKNAQSTDGSGSDFHVKYQKQNRIRFGLKYAPLRTKLHLMKEIFFGMIGI